MSSISKKKSEIKNCEWKQNLPILFFCFFGPVCSLKSRQDRAKRALCVSNRVTVHVSRSALKIQSKIKENKVWDMEKQKIKEQSPSADLSERSV